MKRITILLGLAVLFLTPVVLADVPKLINFQGILRDGSGNPVANGSYSVTFTIYTAPFGGTNLWTETQSVNTVNGLFTILLGAANPVPDSVFNDSSRYLGVAVSSDPEMTPRQKLVSVPFSSGNWSTSGNGGTTAGRNFLGTTDNQALELKVNNARGFRLEPTILGTNLIGGNSANSVTAGVFAATIGGGGYGAFPNLVTDDGGTVGGGVDNLAGDNAGLTGDKSFATVGGGSGNTARGSEATVGGGNNNTASGDRSTVGGGLLNVASEHGATVGGGNRDTASGFEATVGGGNSNTARGEFSTVPGGRANHAAGGYSFAAGQSDTASGFWATVGGGVLNIADDSAATVSGGRNNRARGWYSTVGGGGGPLLEDSNSALGDWSTVGGGSGNSARYYSTIGGGALNVASGTVSTIGGGQSDTASGDWSVISGGYINVARSRFATIGGGGTNLAADTGTTVAGGRNNKARGRYATVGGGGGANPVDSNSALGQWSTVSGGRSNDVTISSGWSTIGGGENNIVSSSWSTVGGGQANSVSEQSATISGGGLNSASASFSTVGGGFINSSSDTATTVAGGRHNQASGRYATIGGGGGGEFADGNRASGGWSSIGGGKSDTSSGNYSTVPGGYANKALGDYSFASGRQAKAIHSGAFVWGDNTVADFASTAANQFLIRAAGGVGIGSNNPAGRLHVEDVEWNSTPVRITGLAGAVIGPSIDMDARDGTAGNRYSIISTNSGAGAGGGKFAIYHFGPTNSGYRLIIDSTGNVGINTNGPTTSLHVTAVAADVATFNRNTNDGIIVRLDQAGITEGTISVSGTTVSYNAFTGSHYGWTEEQLERGELVSLTGVNQNSHDNPKSEIIYGIRRSSIPNDPACLGSYLALSEPNQPYSSENPHLIMAVGNGEMWVVDEGQNIQPGDYLISSSTPGHAMKDDEEKYPIGHIVARAAEGVEWSTVTEMIGGKKHKKISVLFGNFVRGDSRVTETVEEQQQTIEELRKEVGELKELVEKLLSSERKNVIQPASQEIGLKK